MSEAGCGPGPQEEDYEPDLLTLEDESGAEHTFEVLDAAEVDGVRYLAMVPYGAAPQENLSADAEMIIMRAGLDDGGEEFLSIVDEPEELAGVGQVFLHRLKELYDIDLEELTGQKPN